MLPRPSVVEVPVDHRSEPADLLGGDAPDDGVVHGGVAVHENVSERDDLADLRYEAREVGIRAR